MIHLLVDSDFGVDDLVSNLVLLSTNTVSVEGFFTVEGNVSVHVSLHAAKITLSLLKKPHIPIFKGASGPLIKGPMNQKTHWEPHGVDGFGDFTSTDEWIEFNNDHVKDWEIIQHSKEVAASALVRMVNEKPGYYTYVICALL